LPFGLDGRQAFQPAPQVVSENERASTALPGLQPTFIDRIIDTRPTGAAGDARFGECVGKLCVHRNLTTIVRGQPGEYARA
jgi:hypothetical protein